MREALKTNGFKGLLVAITSYLTLLATFHYTDGIFYVFSSGSMAVVFWLCLGCFYYSALRLLNARLGWTCLLGGAVLSVFQTLGEKVFTLYGWEKVPIKLVGYTLLYAAVLCHVFAFAQRRSQSPPAAHSKLVEKLDRALSPSRKSLLAVAGLLVVCWLPYFIVNWPGLVSPDVQTQILMWQGVSVFTSHHPVLHTAFVGLSVQLGQLLGNESLGVGIGMALQVVAMALAVACALRQMAHLGARLVWRVGVLLFYALFPVFGWYATTLWKDVWLAAFALLFYLVLVELCRTGRDFFRSKGHVACLVLSALGLILSKNNGIYLFIIALLAVLVTQKGCRRQVLAGLLAGVAFWMVLEGPIYQALGVEKGDVREALSIPMLQIAKVVAVSPETISNEDRALIDAIMPFDQLGELYDPHVSDDIKRLFNSGALKDDPLAYLGLWVRLGLDSPVVYLYSFLEQTYGYWYPEVRYWIFSDSAYTHLRPDGKDFLVDERDSWTDGVRSAWEQETQNVRGIPGVAMLFSVGFAFWLLVAAALYAFYTRRWELLPPMALFLGVWLTCMASPVFAEYRYAYPAILCVPVVLGLTFGTKGSQSPQKR